MRVTEAMHIVRNREDMDAVDAKKPQQCLFMTTRLGCVINREKTSITKKTNKQTPHYCLF